MISKPYPAFGYVLLRTQLKAGEIVTDDALVSNMLFIDKAETDESGSINGSRGAYIWFLISGSHTYTDVATGEVDRHGPGWCTLVHKPAAGAYKFDVLEDSEHVCFSPTVNKDRSPVIPPLEFFDLADGSSCDLPHGTKLYLLRGTLSLAGKEIPSMRQIRIASDKQTVTAIGRCQGYIFKI